MRKSGRNRYNRKQRYARTRRGQAKVCSAKIAYSSGQEAMVVVKKASRTHVGVRPYRCLACRKWHLGHREPRVIRVLDQLAA